MTDLPVSAVPYPALRLDAGGRVVAANPIAEAIFAADPVGRPLAALFEEALPEAPDALVARLGDGAPVTVHGAPGQARFEARAQRLGDGALVVLVSLSVHDARRIDVDLLALAVDATNNSIVISDVTLPDRPLIYANDYFLQLSGYRVEEVIGRNCRFLQIGPDGTRDDDGEGQKEALDAIRDGLARAEPVSGVVLRNYAKDGSLFYNELYLTPITDADGRMTHVIGVQNDVTDRVRAERERDRQLSYLREIFAASALPLGLLERGEEGGLLHVLHNDAAGDALGLSANEGTDLADAAPRADRWAAAAQSVEQTGAPTRFDVVRGGQTFEVILSPVAADVGRGTDGPARFLYLAADVTDGRAAAEDLLNVSNRQFKQIAQDIHDGVGQSLVGASMLGSALARDLDGTVHSDEADRLRRLIGRSLDHLRSFALGLDPLDIDNLGVADALRRLAAEAEAALDVHIDVIDALGDARLAEDVLIDVYRIAQEALTNAVRHGAAQTVELRLAEGDRGGVLLDVTDDGCGIGPGPSHGMGLRTMRARAVRHGGALAVEPRDEGGTRVRLELPPVHLLSGDAAAGH